MGCNLLIGTCYICCVYCLDEFKLNDNKRHF